MEEGIPLNLQSYYTPNSFRPELNELIECGLFARKSFRRYSYENISYHVPTNVFRINNKVTDIPSINHLKMIIWEIKRSKE